MEKSNDSHLSRGGAQQPSGPTRQHHRLADGDKVNGMSNPNGSPPNTASKMAGQSKNY